MEDQEALAAGLASRRRHARPSETLAVSTGLIGTRLPVDRIEPRVAELVSSGLSRPPTTVA